MVIAQALTDYGSRLEAVVMAVRYAVRDTRPTTWVMIFGGAFLLFAIFTKLRR